MCYDDTLKSPAHVTSLFTFILHICKLAVVSVAAVARVLPASFGKMMVAGGTQTGLVTCFRKNVL